MTSQSFISWCNGFGGNDSLNTPGAVKDPKPVSGSHVLKRVIHILPWHYRAADPHHHQQSEYLWNRKSIKFRWVSRTSQLFFIEVAADGATLQTPRSPFTPGLHWSLCACDADNHYQAPEHRLQQHPIPGSWGEIWADDYRKISGSCWTKIDSTKIQPSCYKSTNPMASW